MKSLWIFIILGLLALGATWFSWYAFIKAIPPIKVEIIGGCK